MAQQGELFGHNGVLEQIMLWGTISEVLSTLGGPALTALQQDLQEKHPLLALPPETAAQAYARTLLSGSSARSEAARGGIDAGRFATLAQLAETRLDPATAAQAAVRGVVTNGYAEKQAAQQGMDATNFKALLTLAPTRIDPQSLAMAVDRTFITAHHAEAEAKLQGMDAGDFAVLLDMVKVHLPPAQLAQAVAYGMMPDHTAEHEAALQGMAPEWLNILRLLSILRLPPAQLAQAVTRGMMPEHLAQAEAALQGLGAGDFAILRDLETVRLPPQQLAQAVEHNLMPDHEAQAQAALQGIAGPWWTLLRDIETVRLAPADLATAVLRSYLTESEAQKEATPQGVSPDMLHILADLAGDAPGPDQLVSALLRKIIPAKGKGAGSVSYEQGIAETRLHNKWAPVLEQLGNALLSPPDLASAVIRNFMDANEATKEAGKSGVAPELFQIMQHLAGDAPGPQQLAEALRRGAIKRDGTGPKSTSFQQGIAEGRLADKWAPVIEALAKIWPTPVDALNAALKGQVTEQEGKHLYELLGGDLQFYTWLLDTQGEGPSPLQAADWARRGIIPWDGIGPEKTSYAQAVKESHFRDKWASAYRQSVQYVPPPETVRTLLEVEAITQKEAADYWHQSGLDDKTITAYLHAAQFNNTAATRGLAINEVLNLLYSQVIGENETANLLQLFHVPDHTAKLLIQYTLVRRDISAIDAAVSHIRSLLTARKIGVQTAKEALRRLGIPAATVDDLVQTMELEAAVSVRTLTEAQIVDAWAEQVFSEDEARQELEAIGYTAYDAWALLSIKNKAPLKNKPVRESVTPPPRVTPGVT